MTDVRQRLVDRYGEEYPQLLFLEGSEFDAAILGVIEEPSWGRFEGPVVCYDAAKVIAILAETMSDDEAEEYFAFNTAGAFMGTFTPCFLYAVQP